MMTGLKIVLFALFAAMLGDFMLFTVYPNFIGYPTN